MSRRGHVKDQRPWGSGNKWGPPQIGKNKLFAAGPGGRGSGRRKMLARTKKNSCASRGNPTLDGQPSPCRTTSNHFKKRLFPETGDPLLCEGTPDATHRRQNPANIKPTTTGQSNRVLLRTFHHTPPSRLEVLTKQLPLLPVLLWLLLLLLPITV